MVDKAKVATVVFGVLALIFFIASLATPWFIVTNKEKNSSIDYKCSVTILYFWEQLECSSSGSAVTVNLTTYECECGDTDNWRQSCRDFAGDNGCKDLFMCFDITGALVGTSMGVFLLGFVCVIVINVAGKLEVKMTWIPVGLYSLSLAILIVPIVYYPLVFPDAYEKGTVLYDSFSISLRAAGGCDFYSSNQELTPCDVYSGSSSVDESGITNSITWGSAGWVLALLTLFLLGVNLLQAIRGRRRNFIVGNY